MKQITVSEKEENQRLDKYLLKYFNKAPKSFVYKMLRKKRIKLNGAKSAGDEPLKKGDEIHMYIAEDTIALLHQGSKLNTETSIAFTALYEDRSILVVDKPAGVLSQKQKSSDKNTLVEQAAFYLWEKGEYDPDAENAFAPALCNRLDRNTSGVVIIGKSTTALKEVGKMLQNGCVVKSYLALVKGHASHGDKLKAFLSKDNKSNTVTVYDKETEGAKPITTIFEPIHACDKYSYLDVTLKTGRPHQIRAHLAFEGFPVVGDKKYGHKGTNMTFLRKYKLNRQFLHSYKITFANIKGDFSYLNGKEIFSELPSDLSEILEDVF